MSHYDLAIIGSGPGGYVAGLYASRHKLNVCLIEKGLTGGTCLNRGCIPTKALVQSSAIFTALKDAREHGITAEGASIDFSKCQSRKDEIVARLRSGIETLLRAAKVDLIKGEARISAPEAVTVGTEEIKARNIIIAAGSKVSGIPGIKIDEERVLSSDGILSMQDLPRSLLIVGGGVVGCEFASLFNAFGVKVTIVEIMERILPMQSREVSKKLEVIFKKRSIDIYVSSRFEEVSQKVNAEKVLVSVGRIPATEGLGLEAVGIGQERGRVVVDEYLRTNVKNIYAIGDCVNGPALAHKASYDAILACDNILGRARPVDYSNVPNCIWTDPEIASVGLTEEEAKAKCPDVKIAKFPYLASGKAAVMARPDGFVKIIGDKEGGILGVEIFGAEACDLIGEAVLAKTLKVNIKDWSQVIHGHPTLSEIFQEAAHIFCGTGIHSI